MTDPFQSHRPGLGHVGAYQVSGFPFVTGSLLVSGDFAGANSQTKVSFPYVTQAVTIINTSTSSVSLRVHFNSVENTNVIGGQHFITITGSSTSLSMKVKCKEIFVSLDSSAAGNGKFEMFAELTNISPFEMISLTGSGLTL